MVRWFVGSLVCWLVGGLVGRLVDPLVGYLVVWWASRCVGWLFGLWV